MELRFSIKDLPSSTSRTRSKFQRRPLARAKRNSVKSPTRRRRQSGRLAHHQARHRI
jgi:hypothetical protein